MSFRSIPDWVSASEHFDPSDDDDAFTSTASWDESNSGHHPYASTSRSSQRFDGVPSQRFGRLPSPQASLRPPTSSFSGGQRARPFPPPRMDLVRVVSHQRPQDGTNWVGKLQEWDQDQRSQRRTQRESTYAYRQRDNGNHVAQVNVAGSGVIFEGESNKKKEAKQEAAKGACLALRLWIG